VSALAEAYAVQTAVMGAADTDDWCHHTTEWQGREYRLLREECSRCTPSEREAA
jgi:hypothetical protein